MGYLPDYTDCACGGILPDSRCRIPDNGGPDICSLFVYGIGFDQSDMEFCTAVPVYQQCQTDHQQLLYWLYQLCTHCCYGIADAGTTGIDSGLRGHDTGCDGNWPCVGWVFAEFYIQKSI